MNYQCKSSILSLGLSNQKAVFICPSLASVVRFERILETTTNLDTTCHVMTWWDRGEGNMKGKKNQIRYMKGKNLIFS
jgi:hypothetical protein